MEIPAVTFDVNFLALVAGIVLSLFFTYVPKVNTWYAALETSIKQLIMLALLLLTTAAIFGLGCGGIIPINDFVCSQSTAVYFIYIFIQALIANQGTHKISPTPIAVRQAKDPKFTFPGDTE